MKGPKNGVVCASTSYSVTDSLYDKHCCLAISVGQPYHEGIQLETAINLIDNTFTQCTIVLGDSLQRHNLVDLQNPNRDTYQMALDAGEEWIERNNNIISQLSIPYTIRRWDEWLQTDEFQRQLALVKAAYNNDTTFKAGFEETIAIFLKRLKNRQETEDFEKAYQQSLSFLLEEATIIMVMWQKEQFNYIAYPGEAISALQVTYNKFTKPFYEDILHWLPLKFKRYSQQFIETDTQSHVFPSIMLKQTTTAYAMQ